MIVYLYIISYLNGRRHSQSMVSGAIPQETMTVYKISGREGEGFTMQSRSGKHSVISWLSASTQGLRVALLCGSRFFSPVTIIPLHVLRYAEEIQYRLVQIGQYLQLVKRIHQLKIERMKLQISGNGKDSAWINLHLSS